MILGTRNCITYACKQLHTFVKVSIKITLGRSNHPKCKPNVNARTAFPYKSLLSEKINDRIFTLFFPRAFQTYEFILLGKY